MTAEVIRPREGWRFWPCPPRLPGAGARSAPLPPGANLRGGVSASSIILSFKQLEALGKHSMVSTTSNNRHLLISAVCQTLF